MCTKMFTTMVYIPTSAAREKQKKLPGRESNPGLARDRRGYSPLYYRGTSKNASKQLIEAVAYVIAQRLKPLMRRYREDVHKNVHNDGIRDTNLSGTGKTFETKETPPQRRESNPGLARDRRGYSPLYYRGTIKNASKQLIEAVAYVIAQRLKPLMRRYREDVHKNVHNDGIHTNLSGTGKAKETPRPGIEPGSRT